MEEFMNVTITLSSHRGHVGECVREGNGYSPRTWADKG